MKPLLTPKNKETLVKRLKSFAWRAGIMAAVAVLGFIGQNLGLLELDPKVVGIVGLVIAEVTKWLNGKK